MILLIDVSAVQAKQNKMQVTIWSDDLSRNELPRSNKMYRVYALSAPSPLLPPVSLLPHPLLRILVSSKYCELFSKDVEAIITQDFLETFGCA